MGKVEFGSWFQHVRGWWSHRNDPNVLFLHYEDLLGDLEGCLRRIVAFCGFEIGPERFPTILERCSFAFMKQHESQFDHLTGTLWEQGLQLNAFLRKGRAGDWKEHLNPEQEARFDRAYSRQLAEYSEFARPAGTSPSLSPMIRTGFDSGPRCSLEWNQM